MPDTEPAAEARQIFVLPANLLPPRELCFDDNLATTRKSWKQAWKRYEIATGVHKLEGIVCVSTLLSIIGEDGIKAYDTFSWSEGEDPNNIELVLQKFDQFCAPRTQVTYKRYRFNNRNQEPGENVTNYLTELRTITRNCSHDNITPDEILRDPLVLGIHDNHVCERLLRLNDLTLQQAVAQIKSSEQTQQQVKEMTGDSLVHALQKSGLSEHADDDRNTRLPPNKTNMKECGNCGMSHGRDCPAYGKTCFTSGRMNYFAHKCRALHEEETESQLFMKPQTPSKSVLHRLDSGAQTPATNGHHQTAGVCTYI